jgi:hypothetical protein
MDKKENTFKKNIHWNGALVMSSHFSLFVDDTVSGVAHLCQLQKLTAVYKCTILLASFPCFVIKLSVGVNLWYSATFCQPSLCVSGKLWVSRRIFVKFLTDVVLLDVISVLYFLIDTNFTARSSEIHTNAAWYRVLKFLWWEIFEKCETVVW